MHVWVSFTYESDALEIEMHLQVKCMYESVCTYESDALKSQMHFWVRCTYKLDPLSFKSEAFMDQVHLQVRPTNKSDAHKKTSSES